MHMHLPELPTFPPNPCVSLSPLPGQSFLADAITTTLSLMATYGQAKKKWESWLLWMTADVIFIPLYHYKGLTLTAILYVGFFLLCVKGLVEWRRALREVRASTQPTPTPAGPLESVAP